MDSEALARCVTNGVAALAREDWNGASNALRPAVESQALAEHADLQDVRARVLSLYAQACLGANELVAANQAVREALRILRTLGDEAGLRAVRDLSTEIFQAGLRQRQQADRTSALLARLEVPANEAIAGASPVDAAEILIEYADALLISDNPSDAKQYAERALSIAIKAGSLREQILAEIALARSCPATRRERLASAWARAEEAGEFNLVTLVKNVADALGVELPKLYGASGMVK